MADLSKILNSKISKIYLSFAVLGIIIGSILTTFCVDIYTKINATFLKEKDKTHLIVNKKVGLLNTLSLSDNSFSQNDVKELREQPFIDEVGEIISSSCRIWAFRDKNPLKFKTDIFFEALDDKYLDKKPREWKWKEGDEFFPVMVNSDFLKLYNFAFSKTQNLPQFSAATIGQLTVLVEVRGNGKKEVFKSRIVGVSERAPSFVVPKNFLEYVNKTYDNAKSNEKFSRLMLKVPNPSDPKFTNYLKKEGIIANQDILNSGSSKTLLTQVIAGEVFQALIIMLLAIILLVITFELLISNSKKDIELLKQLGFHTKQILHYFTSRFFKLYIAQFIVVGIFSIILGNYVSKELEIIGFEEIPMITYPAILSIALYFGLYYFFFRWRISNALKK